MAAANLWAESMQTELRVIIWDKLLVTEITPVQTKELTMKIKNTSSSMRFDWSTGLVTCALFGVAGLGVQAHAQQASGGGTYLVEPGIRSEFQFDQTRVQCKIGHAILGDGTVFQMLMFSTSVESVSIDSAAGTVTITGNMVSIVNLRFPDGTKANLRETVPYVAYGKESGNPGAGVDFFSLTVDYTDTSGLDQFDLFGSPATFSGTLVTGNVTVK